MNQTKVPLEQKPSRYGIRGKPIHATTTDRQRAYRERQSAERDNLRAASRELLDALATAAEQGRCAWLTNHLPEEPGEAMREVAQRLDGRRVTVLGPEKPRKERRQRQPENRRALAAEMEESRQEVREWLALADASFGRERTRFRRLAERRCERYQRDLRRLLTAVGLR